MGRPPSFIRAGTCGAVLHDLKAVLAEKCRSRNSLAFEQSFAHMMAGVSKPKVFRGR
jgi:hypothetical protein